MASNPGSSKSDNLSDNTNDGESQQKQDDYFMEHASLAKTKSKDPVTKVGACLVSESNQIIGIGYNDMPDGCSSLPWTKPETEEENTIENKQLYVCHAEMNAILHSDWSKIKNSKLYVTLYPCNECAKLIIQSGIREVIHSGDRPDKIKYEASESMLKLANINPRKVTKSNST